MSEVLSPELARKPLPLFRSRGVRVVEVLPVLEKWLQERNYAVVVDEESAVYFSASDVMARSELARARRIWRWCFGGDGTLLSAARAVSKAGTLILGVNLGTLGFMTELAMADLYPALEAIEKEQYIVDSRSMLRGSLIRDGEDCRHARCVERSGGEQERDCALESLRAFRGCGVRFQLPRRCSDHRHAHGFDRVFSGRGRADSEPGCGCFLITPVSPHGLTHRPVVVRDTVEIEIRVKTGKEEAYLSFDGQVGCRREWAISCAALRRNIRRRLLRFQKTFFEVLATKLKWGER
jgi:NAD+ kinase